MSETLAVAMILLLSCEATSFLRIPLRYQVPTPLTSTARPRLHLPAAGVPGSAIGGACPAPVWPAAACETDQSTYKRPCQMARGFVLRAATNTTYSVQTLDLVLEDCLLLSSPPFRRHDSIQIGLDSANAFDLRDLSEPVRRDTPPSMNTSTSMTPEAPSYR